MNYISHLIGRHLSGRFFQIAGFGHAGIGEIVQFPVKSFFGIAQGLVTGPGVIAEVMITRIKKCGGLSIESINGFILCNWQTNVIIVPGQREDNVGGL